VDDDCTYSLGYYFFLNNPAVKQALHVNTTMYWAACNNYLFYHWHPCTPGSYPDILWLVNNTKLRILVYSGDTDPAVPFTDTLYWIG